MSRYLFGRGADQDLEEIKQYLLTVPVRPHARIAAQIGDALRAVAAKPYSGRYEPGLSRDFGFEVRSWPVSNYRIFYMAKSGRVEVIGILHGARDHISILRDRIQ